MDIVQDLRERRGLFDITSQMMAAVGIECEEKGLESAARQAYAAAFVMVKQLAQVDQVLAVVDGDLLGGVMRTYEAPIVCQKCGVENALQAVVNVLVSEDEQGWESVDCASCAGGQIGLIRQDAARVPRAYTLTVSGVAGAEPDVRTNEELKKVAVASLKDSDVEPDELPPAGKLRATLYGETLVGPITAEVRAKQEADIREKLAQAKGKIGVRQPVLAASEEDDF